MAITKKEVITEVYELCTKNNDMIFDNDTVKRILKRHNSKTNPYDMTKLDDLSTFPEILINNDFFIAHIGKGKHQFVKGIKNVFHDFEKIKKEECIVWPYRPSILNDFSVSESSILSLCFNQRIIHDFLYLDIAANPKIYNSERKRGITFEYSINGNTFNFEGLQIEIDLTTELSGKVTVFEGKNTKNPNNWLDNFNIYQLYNPFRYYYDLKKSEHLSIKEIDVCYLVRQKKEDGSNIRLYKYTFADYKDITSIQLLKKREYRLMRRDFDE
ncbi:type II restriction enzyme [Candidatus Magnetomonas plexicatena]|uniref:type II restriction enzyme n=1 Tax=Candidatus Magnetomonas plexicatena TaxID=2552947 RepID=UPI0011054A3C|nr:hypothetical protein E2O03_000550 [Nitrospirales bacterium LBB_01]